MRLKKKFTARRKGEPGVYGAGHIHLTTLIYNKTKIKKLFIFPFFFLIE